MAIYKELTDEELKNLLKESMDRLESAGQGRSNT